MSGTPTLDFSGIQAVFFDCDGVLVDSEPAMARAGALALRDFGLPVEPEDFTPYIGTGEDTYIGNVVRKHGGTVVPKMKEHLYEKYVEICQTYVPPMPGASALVRQLRKNGYRVAMVTSADQIKADANLRVLGLAVSDFDAVVTGSDVSRKKPFPDIYLYAAEHCGVDPLRALVVEDAESGVQSACAAGMRAIGLTSSLTAERLLTAGAHKIVGRLDELASLLGLDE